MRELATKELYDASGRRYLVMNQDLYLQLENKLIKSVLKFKLRFNRGC